MLIHTATTHTDCCHPGRPAQSTLGDLSPCQQWSITDHAQPAQSCRHSCGQLEAGLPSTGRAGSQPNCNTLPACLPACLSICCLSVSAAFHTIVFLFLSVSVCLSNLTVCKLCGGKPTFGFNPHEIGNRSIRSGAAMALFLADHSPARIMILGRWSSDAFLVCIRPQVLEWTNNMSYDMINYETFLDSSSSRNASKSFPLQVLPTYYGRDSSTVVMPKLHLAH